MYYKRGKGYLLVNKNTSRPQWFRWTHHTEGKTHCEECLRLDGCWFAAGKAPPCPHHPYCHCTLEPLDYTVVFSSALVHSDYSKYDPYLFDPDNFYKHKKNLAFESWGYSISDSHWLQKEIERQAREKYILGDYKLGVLNKYGQRISIRIEIPRKNGSGTVSFLSGWNVCAGGQLSLNTPYGGK